MYIYIYIYIYIYTYTYSYSILPYLDILAQWSDPVGTRQPRLCTNCSADTRPFLIQAMCFEWRMLAVRREREPDNVHNTVTQAPDSNILLSRSTCLRCIFPATPCDLSWVLKFSRHGPSWEKPRPGLPWRPALPSMGLSWGDENSQAPPADFKAFYLFKLS